MSGEVDCTTGRADWARGIRGCLIWGIPIAILLMSPGMGTRYLVIVWPALLTFMGVTCLLNARHCGRIHCYFTGPFSKGWSTLSAALPIGSVALCCVPEWILGRYRSSSNSS
jgi:hypothetical protein